MDLPNYREVFVVSDLHLGGYSGRFDPAKNDWVRIPEGDSPAPGDRNFRIFRDAPALSAAIGEAARAPGPVALVLNGDIVDFLADESAKAFDPDGALAKLKVLIDDPEQHQVWLALREYTKVEGHDLVLVIGNHDVELGLYDVQEYLIAWLSDGDPQRRRRIVHCFDGEGFRCAVGGTTVLCVHGNSADPWNEVDYATVAKISDARRLGTRQPAFRGNPGSTLVVEHMNAVKRRYQWVDLLKPEREGAAAVVQVLDQGRRLPILKLAGTIRTPRSLASVFIGEDGGASDENSADAIRTVDDRVAPAAVEQWLAEAQELDTRGVEPIELAGDDGMLEAVYSAKRSFELVFGKSLRELLRDHVPMSTAWDPFAEDDVFVDQDRTTDPGVDFLIVGHTHLERCLKRKRGRGHYFNSGTWIKLVRIPSAALVLESTFAPVRQALEEGSLEALEKPIDIGTGTPVSLVRSLRTVVRVAEAPAGASGALFHVEGDEQDGFVMTEVKGTRRALPGGVR